MIYEETLTTEDLSAICRTCLIQQDSHNLLPMKGLYFLSGEIELLEILMKYTSFEENENYPQQICLQCVAKAEEAYCFFNKCNESNEILEKLVGSMEESEDELCEMSLIEGSVNEEDQEYEVITITNEECGDAEVKLILKHGKTRGDASDDNLNIQKETEDFSFDEKSQTVEYIHTVKCKFCRMELEPEELEEHEMKYGHFRNSSCFLCPYCDSCTKNITNFKRHLRTHSNSSTKEYECHSCQQVFKWFKNYSDHLKLHETNEEEKLICPECGFLLPTMAALQSHRAREHSKVADGQNQWTCQQCGEIFGDIRIFKKHLKDIHFQKDFHCIICGKDCEDKRTLYYHEQLHLDEFGIECSYCNKKLLTQEKLVLHQRIHRYLTKKHICHICNKGFKQLDKLEAHIRVHTGEKPYSCTFCGKAFNHPNNLHHHTRLHTGDTPYKCLFCLKEFSNSHSLRKHMNSHSKEKDVVV